MFLNIYTELQGTISLNLLICLCPHFMHAFFILNSKLFKFLMQALVQKVGNGMAHDKMEGGEYV